MNAPLPQKASVEQRKKTEQKRNALEQKLIRLNLSLQQTRSLLLGSDAEKEPIKNGPIKRQCASASPALNRQRLLHLLELEYREKSRTRSELDALEEEINVKIKTNREIGEASDLFVRKKLSKTTFNGLKRTMDFSSVSRRSLPGAILAVFLVLLLVVGAYSAFDHFISPTLSISSAVSSSLEHLSGASFVPSEISPQDQKNPVPAPIPVPSPVNTTNSTGTTPQIIPDRETANLTNYGLVNFTNDYGEIYFLENISSERELSQLLSAIQIIEGKVSIDTFAYPELHHSAQIVFKNINYSNPIVLYDGRWVVDAPLTAINITPAGVKVPSSKVPLEGMQNESVAAGKISSASNTAKTNKKEAKLSHYQIIVPSFSTWQILDNTFNGTLNFTTIYYNGLGLSGDAIAIYQFDNNISGVNDQSSTGSYSIESYAPTLSTSGCKLDTTCLFFNESGTAADQISVPYNLQLNPPLNFSWCVWHKSNSSAALNDRIIYYTDAVRGWYFMSSGSTQALYIYNSSGVVKTLSSSAASYNNQWVDLCFVLSGTDNVTLYVNGTVVNSSLIPGNYTPNSVGQVLNFGSTIDGYHPYNGWISCPTYWNVTLSTAQVSQYHSSTICNSTLNSPSAVWPLNVSAKLVPELLQGFNGNAGAFYNNSGVLNGGFVFDGLTDKLVCTNPPELNNNSQLTAIAFFKADSILGTGTDNVILWAEPASGNQIYTMAVRSNMYRAYAYNDSGGLGLIQYSATPPTGQWVMYALTYNSSASQDNLRMFINCTSVASANLTGNLLNASTAMLSIGKRYYGTSPFYGTIDEVRLYNRTLTPAELCNIYQNFTLYKYVLSGDYLSEVYNFSEYDPEATGNTWITVAVPDTTNISMNGRAGNCSNLTNYSWNAPYGQTPISYDFSIGGQCFQYQAFFSGNYNSTPFIPNVTITSDRTTLVPAISFSFAPANGTTTSNTNLSINISIMNASDLQTFLWGWNGSNTTFYSKNLVLMLNLDNLSSFGENSTYAVDASWAGNNCTFINGTAWNVSTKYGSGLVFDGTNDLAVCGNASGLSISKNITVAVWVYAHSAGSYDGFLNKASDASWSDGYGMYVAGSAQVKFWVGKYSTSFANGSFSLNTWHYVVGMANGTHARIFVDGIEGTARNYSGTITSNTNVLEIGRGNIDTQNFDGVLDEVRIYNASLSELEIAQLYRSNFNKYASDQWNFYTNQSDYPLGNYTYSGYSKDTAGNENTTDTRIFSLVSKFLLISEYFSATNVSPSTVVNISGQVFYTNGSAAVNGTGVSIYHNGTELTSAYGDGSDGALVVSSGTMVLNTSTRPGGFNYTSIYVNTSAILSANGSSPLIMYSWGSVLILGTINLSGAKGKNVTNTAPGAGGLGSVGGWDGGAGGPNPAGLALINGTNGAGPGGGKGGINCGYGSGDVAGGGGGGSYALNGSKGGDTYCSGGKAENGSTYGSADLFNFTGGSGGGGGGTDNDTGPIEYGGGGGGGGGAVKIVAPEINVSGAILAVGGEGGNHSNVNDGEGGAGGGGSGGAIWLIASSMNISGNLSVAGGRGGSSAGYGTVGGDGGKGRIRLDFFNISGAGIIVTGSSFNGTFSSSSVITDASGNYNFTFSALAIAGTYPVIVNATSMGYYAVNTTNLTVVSLANLPPFPPNLISIASGNTTTNRTPALLWNNSYDPEGGTISYNLLIDDSPTFNNPEVNVSNIANTTGSNTTYNVTTELSVDTTYYWKVCGFDGTGWGNFSSAYNFTLQSYLALTLPRSTVDFGNVNPSQSTNTSLGSPLPFWGENSGNVPANVTVTATPYFTSVSFPSSNYRFRIEANESGAFNTTNSTMSWTNMTNVSTVSDIFDLDWHTFKNDFLVGMSIFVPPVEFPGAKSSTVTLTIS